MISSTTDIFTQYAICSISANFCTNQYSFSKLKHTTEFMQPRFNKRMIRDGACPFLFCLLNLAFRRQAWYSVQYTQTCIMQHIYQYTVTSQIAQVTEIGGIFSMYGISVLLI